MKAGRASRLRCGLALAAGLIGVSVVSPASGSPKAAVEEGTIVRAVPTEAYGSVLVVGGRARTGLTGYPIFEFSGDGGGKFGCGTKRAMGLDPDSGSQVPLTCTGPESDMLGNVLTDDWPALTTTGAPIAGRGVNRKLLGTVYRRGIGDQITYGGHPLYLFSPPQPFPPSCCSSTIATRRLCCRSLSDWVR